MDRKSYLWRSVTWFVGGTLLGTYVPRSAPSVRLHEILRHLLDIYPAWLHLPLIAFLLVALFRPTADLLRRYRHNWQVKGRLFTVVEGTVLFLTGWVFTALLNGSLPHRLSLYSQPEALALKVWLSSFLLLLLSALVYSYRKLTKESPVLVVDELIDVPISDDDHDILDRQKFVEDLFAQIRGFSSNAPFVFGLNGPWGSGKTSVLNLLRNRLNKDKTLLLVDFNPWYFQSAETIIRRFYDSIAVSINREFFYPELRSTARRYARILGPILKLYGFDSSTMDDATVEEMKRLVETYIAKTGRKLVVIVDDLERSCQQELLTTLQIVRLSGNFQNTIFILAYDHSQLVRQLKRQGVSPDFLSKIVQYPIDLPAADKNQIDRFVIYSDSKHTSHLDRLLNDLKIDGPRRKEFDENSVYIYASILSPFFSTLRDAKRFLTGLFVRLPVVKDEVHLLDFFLLEVLRVFASSIYQDIWDNPHFYIPAWTRRIQLSSPFGLEYDNKDRDSRRQSIREHVNNLLIAQSRRTQILEILKNIFAVRISDAFGRPTNYGGDFALKYRAQKRLTHPDSFEKYFLLAVPKGILSDAAVEETLDSWARSEHPEETIFTDFAKLRESNQLQETVERIVLFLERVPETLAKPMLRAASRSVRSASSQEDRSEQNTYFSLILNLLNEKIPQSETQIEAEEMMDRVSQIDVAVRILQGLLYDESNATWYLRRRLKLEPLQESVRRRFEKEFVEPKADIFTVNPLPNFVLFQIGSYNSGAAKMVNRYLATVLDDNPQYVGKLLNGFFQASPGGLRSFNFEQLKGVYNIDMLAGYIRRQGDRTWESDPEKEAVDRFMKAVSQDASATSQ